MTSTNRPTQTDSPQVIDRASAEAMGYRCITASEYAQLCSDEALLAQLQKDGLL